LLLSKKEVRVKVGKFFTLTPYPSFIDVTISVSKNIGFCNVYLVFEDYIVGLQIYFADLSI